MRTTVKSLSLPVQGLPAASQAAPQARASEVAALVRASRAAALVLGLCLGAQAQAQAQPAVPDYGPTLTLDMARKAMSAADALARGNGWNVAIAILDSGGQMVMYQKFDNTHHASIAVAQGKARTALDMRRPTRLLEEAVASGGGALGLLSARELTLLQGGVPIVSGGKIVGSIGVSGVASANDEKVAFAGAEALK